jgi:hypothetical protein
MARAIWSLFSTLGSRNAGATHRHSRLVGHRATQTQGLQLHHILNTNTIVGHLLSSFSPSVYYLLASSVLGYLLVGYGAFIVQVRRL